MFKLHYTRLPYQNIRSLTQNILGKNYTPLPQKKHELLLTIQLFEN